MNLAVNNLKRAKSTCDQAFSVSASMERPRYWKISQWPSNTRIESGVLDPREGPLGFVYCIPASIEELIQYQSVKMTLFRIPKSTVRCRVIGKSIPAPTSPGRVKPWARDSHNPRDQIYTSEYCNGLKQAFVDMELWVAIEAFDVIFCQLQNALVQAFTFIPVELTTSGGLGMFITYEWFSQFYSESPLL